MTHRSWSPEQDLAALLDALTDELLAASDHELRASLADSGEDPDEAAGFMRRLLAAAETKAVGTPAPGLPPNPLPITVVRVQ